MSQEKNGENTDLECDLACAVQKHGLCERRT